MMVVRKKKHKEKKVKKKVSFILDKDFSGLKITDIRNRDSRKLDSIFTDMTDDNSGHIMINSQLELSYHDDVNGGTKYNLHQVYCKYTKDKNPIQKLKSNCFDNNDLPFNINDINNQMKNKYVFKASLDSKTISKINLDQTNFSGNNVSDINE